MYEYFVKHNLNGGWPPFNGAKSILKTEKGKQLTNKVFDRFQKNEELGGGFASPVPENSVYTLQSRALEVNYDDLEMGQNHYYFKFKIKNVSNDLEFEYGEAIPWFEELGGAIQIRSSKGFHQISDNIEILEKWKFENGQWKKLKFVNGIWK